MDSRHETRGDTRPRWKTRVLKCGWSTRDHENLGNDKAESHSHLLRVDCSWLAEASVQPLVDLSIKVLDRDSAGSVGDGIQFAPQAVLRVNEAGGYDVALCRLERANTDGAGTSVANQRACSPTEYISSQRVFALFRHGATLLPAYALSR